ncbi:FkbM family methyltransferase [Chloroflexota bacterium]
MDKKMKKKLKRLRRKLIYLLPRNRFMYRVCRRYVYYYDGLFDIDMYANGEIRALKYVISSLKKPVVFDVGANIGDWCQAALQINPQAQIHCFEPGSYAFGKLTGRKFPPNVICNHFGFSSRPSIEKMTLYGNSKSMLNSLYDTPRYGREPVGYEEIKLETVTNYCKDRQIERVDFMKIDVEGHEYEALVGASEMLQQNRVHAIQFEYGETYIHAGRWLKDIFEYVAKFNYCIYRILHHQLLPIQEYSTDLENYAYANFLLLLRDQSVGEKLKV